MVGVRFLALSALIMPAGLAAQASPTVGDTVPSIVADSAPRPASALSRLFGWSGKLRVHFLPAMRAADSSAMFTGDSATGAQVAFITLLPFSVKSGGRVGGYHVGYWPAERRRARTEMYENPDGFVEVTPENEDTPVSEHFRLRDFLTHDQEGIWPKYMVLREEIVDKLELIIDDLQAHGHRVDRLVVMSGFRTPEYNAQGVGRRGGRARDSRHQFGDAADIYVDNGSGAMADLNGDGRVDSRDARVLLESVDRVEAAHPELVGGAGIYRGTRLHGPFLHVDCRGAAARWSVTAGERLHRAKRKRVS
jgi:Peptidase M15